MLAEVLNANLAIIGGGRFCKMFLQCLFEAPALTHRPRVLGVADVDLQAAGMVYAREKGVFTTADYRTLFPLAGLQVLLEITTDATLAEAVRQAKPAGVQLIDHVEARALWTALQLELETNQAMQALARQTLASTEITQLFRQFAHRLTAVIQARNNRYIEIERASIRSQWILSQIIQGSTIPTFVIDRQHVVTHWNKAMERLSGIPAERVVGSNDHWLKFWDEKRPTLADAVLDGFDPEVIDTLYGRQWRRSALIEGAYEAEVFFPKLGREGKWCWFTAAPIKAPDGTVIGAIETLWDKTEEKLAEQQRSWHTQQLSETAANLAKSERTLAQIIQGSTIPTFVIDEHHTVTHWNRALEKLSGVSAADVVGTRNQWKPFYGSQRPALADVILDQLGETELKALYGGNWRPSALIEGACEAEGFFPSLGEEGKWCWFTAAPIRSPDGTIVGAIETLWDKTEDKKAEQQRERHTQELQALCKIYSALNADLDLEGRIGKAAEEVRAFMAADTLCIYLHQPDGRFALRHCYGRLSEACEPSLGGREAEIVEHVARSGDFYVDDAQYRDPPTDPPPAAAVPPLSLAYIPISSKERRSIGVIRIGTLKPRRFSLDQKHLLELIGNRIGAAIENARLQDQYIKSQEKYESLFDSDPHPIFILEPSSLSILDINHRAQDSYGYDYEELLGTSFLALGDADDEELVQGLGQLAKQPSRLFTKKRHYRKGGQLFYVNINVSHARYGESDVLIASTTDISEIVEKEAQLVQASKLTTIGQMAAGMAHEINQPLNVIQVCADLLDKLVDRNLNFAAADLKGIAQDIRRNVQRATGVIQHVRDFARQSDVVRQKVDVNAPIRDVFKVLEHQLRMHQVERVLELTEDLPPILADHNRLEQVFINLVTNAMDAMDEKRALPQHAGAAKRLTIRSYAEGDQVLVAVSDTGIGMSEEVQRKLFDPFFTTKKVGKGTGLGISISYGIVKDYEGEIEVRTALGEGTTFVLRFPAFREEK